MKRSRFRTTSFLGTIRDWVFVWETFNDGQHVQLEKVYRNTKVFCFIYKDAWIFLRQKTLLKNVFVSKKICSMSA